MVSWENMVKNVLDGLKTTITTYDTTSFFKSYIEEIGYIKNAGGKLQAVKAKIDTPLLFVIINNTSHEQFILSHKKESTLLSITMYVVLDLTINELHADPLKLRNDKLKAEGIIIDALKLNPRLLDPNNPSNPNLYVSGIESITSDYNPEDNYTFPRLAINIDLILRYI